VCVLKSFGGENTHYLLLQMHMYESVRNWHMRSSGI
jgi:hypothetical protein